MMEFRSHYNLSLNDEYIAHWFLKVSEKRREMEINADKTDTS